MAVLLLIVLGASAGWLASIIGRTETGTEIARQIAIGIVVSLVSGLLANQGSILAGLTWLALASALVASGAALLAYHAIARKALFA